MDLSLENIWRGWFNFRKGKKATAELDTFEFHLEVNLAKLQHELESGTYRHGNYRKYVVCDNKRREISVAPIRDRVVHRLIYDFLVPIYDKSFIYDAWSCRIGKGLTACIERAQGFLKRNPQAYVWRADIKKFFDSVNCEILLKLIKRKITDPQALNLISEVVGSFGRERESFL